MQQNQYATLLLEKSLTDLARSAMQNSRPESVPKSSGAVIHSRT